MAAGKGVEVGPRPAGSDGDLLVAGQRQIGEQHPSQGVARKVAMLVEPVGEVVAVLALGGKVGDRDASRQIGEIALDPTGGQAPGPVGVIVTSRPSRADAHAVSQAWSPGTATAGSPHDRAEIMSGGPSVNTIHRDDSAAGWGIRPWRVPVAAIISGERVAVGA